MVGWVVEGNSMGAKKCCALGGLRGNYSAGSTCR